MNLHREGTVANTGRKRNIALSLMAACLAMGGIGATHAQTQLNFANLAGGWTGDGGQAKAAYLQGPSEVVIDGAGNLYVSSVWANRIRKITPGGVITTLVGGANGFGGDGGQASKALIDRPSGMVFDAAGNLYFSDSGNRRVRRIAPDGTITTVAGNGDWHASGNGGQAKSAGIGDPTGLAFDKNGNLFIGDRRHHIVRKVTSAGVISTYAGTLDFAGYYGDNGPATSAYLYDPEGIDVDDAGNLYIADTKNNRVRRVATNGTITTYASGLSIPLNVEVDAAGNVYMESDCQIAKRTPANVTTIYGSLASYCDGKSPDGTLATSAQFGYPDGIAVDAAGNIFFADTNNARIVKIAAADSKVYTYAGTPVVMPYGQAGATAMTSYTNAVTVADDGGVMFNEWLYSYRVREISAGKVWEYAGTGLASVGCTGTLATSCSFARVTGLASGPGNVTYIADRATNTVTRVNGNGTTTLFAGGGSEPLDNVPATQTNFTLMGNIALDGAGNLFIPDNRGRIVKVNPAGIATTFAGSDDPSAPIGDNGPATSASLANATHVAADGAGNVFVFAQGLIRKIGLDGIIRRVAGKTFNEDPTIDGFYRGEGGLALNAQPGSVTGMAAHPSGLYFASEGKVRRIRPDGRIETVQGTPNYAMGLAAKFGYLYVTTQNGRVVRAQLPRIPVNDFNGDHRSDVFWRGSTGVNRVWFSAESTTGMAPATIATENKLVAQGDFDGDGKTDIVWRNTLNGNNVVWRAGNANTIMVLATQADQNWTIVGAGDFNGDGKSDLFWRNKVTGANDIWLTANSATKKAASTIPDLKWVLAGIGDFDADGKSDVLWRHTQTGGNLLWSGANAGASKYLPSLAKLTWKVAAIGDFNGDGVSDIVWRDTATGANQIWKSANAYTQMYLTTVPNTQWFIAAAGDYDNDGIDDLVWRNSATGANTLWRNAVGSNQRAMAVWGLSWKIQPVEAQP
ncbi:FG-GAP-like repeat-containing protein [Lysobacter sp. A6]|uniref:FG-GAP-like repeat-containing protein n=1 Tax=Noviluteimonas lactosilytica TaxID=2888523 RepID=A0ABS8JDI2_9GAMM|nr:FG-GAP-like repeat-containing protein [Lysobacter lactosilyticus]MCC8361654.1 FG-GAP-like repeat-containing protein [Lysobacter lactosilyticus]